MEGIKSFLFGDSKSNKVDTQKLRADISSACGIIETVLNIIDILTTEGIHIACQTCGKNKKIRNPQNALYVATHHQTTTEFLNAQSRRYIDHANKDSKCESPVDIDRSERLKEGREKHSNKLNYPIETKGDDSDDDTKNDTNDDKTDKGNQILKNELIEIKNRLRLAQEEKSCLEKKMKEMEGEYNQNMKEAGIELSRLTEENQGCEIRIKDLESKIDQLNNEMAAMKEEISRKEQENDQLRISLDRKNQTHENMVSQMNTEQDNLRMELDSLKREVKDAERSTAKKAQEYG